MQKEMNTVISDDAVAPRGEGQGGPAYPVRSMKELEPRVSSWEEELVPRGQTGVCKGPGAGPKEGREMD